MSKDKSSEQGPFDLDTLRGLVEMMQKHGLTEISLRHGEVQWRLRRGGHEALPMMPPAPMPMMHAPHPPAHAAPAPGPAAAPPESKADAGTLIKSPTVGTFYAAPGPDDPPFVSVGARVNPDTIVCVIEAMKVFNQIPAETSGTIAEILVKNGDPVEYGQPLFRVK